MADAPDADARRAEVARPYTPTALPSVLARWLAFLAIVVGGVCGGLIGWSVTDLQCGTHNSPAAAHSAPLTRHPRAEDTGCTYWAGGGGVVGATIAAGGTAVVSVLVLRAMAEWRRDLEPEDDA